MRIASLMPRAGRINPNITRRSSLTFFAATLAAPIVATAQQTGKVYRIGFLGGASPSGYAVLVNALRLELRDHGYVEGKNITIEYRFDKARDESFERVSLNVDRTNRPAVSLYLKLGFRDVPRPPGEPESRGSRYMENTS